MPPDTTAVTHEDLKPLENKLENVSDKVDLIYYALMGNDLTKDGGLVRRITYLEDIGTRDREETRKQFEALHDKIQELEETKRDLEKYKRYLWGAISGVILMTAQYLFEKFFHVHL